MDYFNAAIVTRTVIFADIHLHRKLEQEDINSSANSAIRESLLEFGNEYSEDMSMPFKYSMLRRYYNITESHSGLHQNVFDAFLADEQLFRSDDSIDKEYVLYEAIVLAKNNGYSQTDICKAMNRYKSRFPNSEFLSLLTSNVKCD